MGIEIDLSQIPHKNIVSVSLIIAGIVIGPLFAIFQFDPALFQSTDFIKLVFIAVGYGTPVLLVNCIFCFNFKAGRGPDAMLALNNLATASAFTIFVFFSPCVAGFFAHINAKQAIVYGFSALVGMGVRTIQKWIWPSSPAARLDQLAADTNAMEKKIKGPE